MSSINYAIMLYELKMRTIRTHRSINYFRIQFWSWFRILLKRINYTLISYVNNKKTKFELVTYYPLHADFLWIDAHNLIRQCYRLSRLPLQFMSYKSHLLCDQLTYSRSREHLSNFIKWILETTDFMITCHLDHPRGYVILIPWDIMVPLLRIPVVTSLY